MSTNSLITCSTCSRCTLRICAMATPTFCTSFGPRWRSTCAASVSPRESRRMAALSTLFSLAVTRASLIGIDPLFHHLSHAARVLRHQALDRIELGFVAIRGARQQDARRAGEAHAVVGQFTVQPGEITKARLATADGHQF